MFRKTPFKSQRGISLIKALKSEFIPHLENLSAGFHPFLTRYRYALFGGMILIMLVSGVLSFTVLRKEKPGKLTLARLETAAAGPNLTGAITAYNELKQIAVIQDRIEALASKKLLSEQDSIQMIQGFRQIDSLYNNIKHQSSP